MTVTLKHSLHRGIRLAEEQFQQSFFLMLEKNNDEMNLAFYSHVVKCVVGRFRC